MGINAHAKPTSGRNARIGGRRFRPPVRPQRPDLLAIGSAALVVALVTAASRLAAFSDGSFSLLWPAAGIGFVLIQVWGNRGLLALALGLTAWAIPAYWHRPALVPLAVVASCIGPWVSWNLVRTRFQSTYEPFARTETLFAFLRAEALVGIPLGTLVGCCSLLLFTDLDWRDLPAVAFSYWIVEFCGAITFAPVVHAMFGGATRLDLGGLLHEIRAAIYRDRLTLTGVIWVAALGFASIYLGEPDYGRAVLYLLLPLLAVNAVQTRAFPGHLTLLIAAVAVLTTRAYASHAAHVSGSAIGADLFVTSLYLVVIACTTLALLAISSERRAALECIEEQAFVDPLTGLLSEAGLIRSLARAVQNSNLTLGLISVRIVNQQAVEQLLGSQAAAAIDRHAAKALDNLLAAPTWGRLGVGRLVGIISSVEHLEGLMGAALAIVGDAVARDGKSICHPVWSVAGVRSVNAHQLTAESLLAALREAEERSSIEGIGAVLEVDQSAANQRHTRTQESERVRNAITQRRIVLYAQAIVPNSKSNQLRRPSIEILAKLAGLDGDLIDAVDWLPFAMRDGLMPALDVAVLRQSLAWFAAHREVLPAFEHCGINLSGSSLGDADLVRRVREAILESELPAEKFMFEITEGQTIANPTRASETIKALRGLGCKIAIDDFGTGLATFDYLKRFEVDCIKIDGAFIRALGTSALDAAIVSSIVRVAQAISVETVAEYVADQKTLGIVKRLGVGSSQGWAIGLPLPLEEFFTARNLSSLGAKVTPLRTVRNVRVA